MKDDNGRSNLRTYIWNNYELAPAWDHTPHNAPLALDHYVNDAKIVWFIKTFIVERGADFNHWAKDYPDLRDGYFTRPYPTIAVGELGYEN